MAGAKAARAIRLLSLVSWPASEQQTFLADYAQGRARLPMHAYPKHYFSDERRQFEAIAAEGRLQGKSWGLFTATTALVAMLQRTGVVDGPVAFLAHGSTAFWATVFTDVWIGVPMVTLYMLAAMQAVPQDLYEAAWTDGAGRAAPAPQPRYAETPG